MAVKAALDANSSLLALLADGADSILDDVPETERFPYLTIGDLQAGDWGTATERGLEHILTVNVWALRRPARDGDLYYEGRKAARDILQQVYESLHEATLAVSGSSFVNCRFQFEQVLRDDTDTYHGVAGFRIVTEPA